MKKLKLALFFLFLLFISCAKDNVDNSDDKYKYPDVAVKVKGVYTIDKVFDFINSFDIEVASINSPVYTSDLPSDSLQYVLDYLNAKAYTHNGNGMLVSGYLDYKTKVITIFPTLFNMKNTTYQADWLESMKILKLKEDTVSTTAGYMIDFHVGLFLYAGMEYRIKRLCADCNVSESRAQKMIEESDKKRSDYFHQFTGKMWTDATQYDLTLRTDILGPERTLERLIMLAQEVLTHKEAKIIV